MTDNGYTHVEPLVGPDDADDPPRDQIADIANRPRAKNSGWANLQPGGKDRYSKQERLNALQQVVDLIQDGGYSQNKAMQEVASDLGLKSPRTLGWWASDLGIQLPTTASARAKGQQLTANSQAAADIANFDQPKRLELSNLLFATVARAAQQQFEAPVPDSGIMRDLSVTYAVLTDKRRLEEGKPTSHELIQQQDAQGMLEQGKERLRIMQGGRAVA